MHRRFLFAAGIALICAACGTDRIVSVGGDLVSRRVDARQGELVDIQLWGGALGTYASPPAVSAAAVAFVDVSLETGSGGSVSPGGPAQRFRFRAIAAGTAIVTFSPLQQDSPVVSDTIVVQ